MDTSETYIKMRLAAIPNMGMGIPPKFFGFNECTWITPTVYIDHKGDWYYKGKCQLERQDQIQEMMGGDWNNLLFRMDEFLIDKDDEIDLDYVSSMEQLWLAFLMKEKHNKTWDGEKWQVSYTGANKAST